jgi:hypothetical protein
VSSIFIECPQCGWEGKIDESLLGRQLKCPKSAISFKAEKGGTYDLGAPLVTPPPEDDDEDAFDEAPDSKSKRKTPKQEAKPKEDYPQELLDLWPDE